MTLARSDKRQQLRDLCSIVVGIRLFNRAAGKGGRSITDCKYHVNHMSTRCPPKCCYGGAKAVTMLASPPSSSAKC